MDKIYFSKTTEEYGFMSNFYPARFTYNGYLFRTSEHFYQANKFEPGSEAFEMIVRQNSPMIAARVGRKKSLPLRPDWNEVKVEIMRAALFLKFSTNKDLADKLIATGDAEIVEKSSRDYFWGCGKDGSGQNMLGKLLVELREILKTK